MNSVLPIYYQIKETIKGWIIKKEFKPGNKIPSENGLAESFNVNRLTVRQAISQLTQEGFLVRKRGAGTFVTELFPWTPPSRSELTGHVPANKVREANFFHGKGLGSDV